jgi:uncharacterized membrane protein/YHS domain-containing protein
MRNTACLALLALVLFALPVAASEEEGEVTNAECPVMEGTPITKELFVDYRGVRVYFCCESCVDDFREDPEAYVANLPEDLVAKMMPVEEWKAAGGWDSPPPSEKARQEHPLGALHLILVHFPVALTAVAAFAALLSLLFAKRFFRTAATYSIVMAALFAAPTFLTGGEAEEAMGVMSDELHERVESHEEAGSIALWVVIGAAVVQVVSYVRPLAATRWFPVVATIAILAAAGMAGYTGYLGGEVAHGAGHAKYLFEMLGL